MNRRPAWIVLALVMTTAFAASAAPAPATHLGFRPCRDMTFHRARAKKVQTNFGCRGARRVLRRLLAHGVGGLPKPTTQIGRWGCRDTRFQHFFTCERRRSGTQAPPSVVFAGYRRRASASAARVRLARCAPFATHGVAVTRLRSTFGCGRAKTVLRRLLRKGISGLPPRTKRSGKWGCGRSHSVRVCTRHGSGTQRTRRILFHGARNGQTEGDPGGPPQPSADTLQKCIDIWNADGSNRATYGFHFYNDHGIREAWVFTLPNPSYPDVLRCAVIFAVPPSDYEYGKDGEVRYANGTGWLLMNQVSDLGDPNTVQQQAGQNVNALLQADASLKRK